MDERIRTHRFWLKESIRKAADWHATGQSLGLPPPPVQKPVPPGAQTVPLPGPERFGKICAADLLSVMGSRRSIRRFSSTRLSLAELAFLLWATQGVTGRHGDLGLARLRPPPVKAFVQRWLIYTIAVMVTTTLLPGISCDGLGWLLLASLILGFLNAILKPLLFLLSLPLIVVTLGLFSLVISALLLYFVGQIIRPFHVEGFGSAMLGALLISLVSLPLNLVLGGPR